MKIDYTIDKDFMVYVEITVADTPRIFKACNFFDISSLVRKYPLDILIADKYKNKAGEYLNLGVVLLKILLDRPYRKRLNVGKGDILRLWRSNDIDHLYNNIPKCILNDDCNRNV